MVHSYRRTDIVIVGGGPAGLAAAIAARRKGFRVLVAERAAGPVDKVCGEGLMPDGVAALNAIGVSLPSAPSFRFRGIRFVEGKTIVEAEFPNGCGLGIRRTALNELLIRSASAAGVDIAWGAKVCAASAGRVDLGGETVLCRWIIGADGQNSRVRKWARLDDVRTERLRFGSRRHFDVLPWTDLVEVYWGDNCQVVITPVSPQSVCAALVCRNPRMRLEEALGILPALAGRLKNAVPATCERGAVSALRVLKSTVRDCFAMVGDASGSVDSLTGQGLCLAFRQATALADAIAAGNLAQYAAAHRRLSKSPLRMSRFMLILDKYAFLRARVLHLLAAHPRVFSWFLANHVGTVTHDASGFRGVFGAGWRVLSS